MADRVRQKSRLIADIFKRLIKAGRRNSGVRFLLFPFAAILVGSLSACNTTPCTNDPLTDSLECASRNIQSGAYDRQTEQIAANAAAVRAASDAEAQENTRLRSQSAQLSQNIARSEQRLANVRREVLETRNRLSELRRQGEISQAESALYESQLNQLEANGSNSGATAEEIAQLEADIAQLRTIVEDL